jgi:23S rRNA (uracil1939-C5)-methyltransferase
LELTIEKLVYGGDGLARLPADERGPGKAMFIPFVLEGERVNAAIVEQKPSFARGQASEVLAASTERVDPQCAYFRRCGGCHYQHSSYEHQLEIKASILKENLRRLAKVELSSELKIHASPAWNYRNRTRLRVQRTPEFALGYYRFNSHALLPVEECPISSPLVNRAMRVVWALGRTGKIGDGVRELEFFCNASDSQLLVEAYVDCGNARGEGRESGERQRSQGNIPAEAWAEELRDVLPETVGVALLASVPARPGTAQEMCEGTGDSQLVYETRRGAYRVSAGSFFQTNRHLTDALVDVVTLGRSGVTALDLYAGVGLFSVVLSREFERVIAVESSPQCGADLEYNSTANVKAVRASTEQYVKNVSGKLRPDLIVVDPPRSGLGKAVAAGVAGLGAARITYVSCDPATLARDLVPMIAAGYGVEAAHLVDLFPQTFHVESVVHLTR